MYKLELKIKVYGQKKKIQCLTKDHKERSDRSMQLMRSRKSKFLITDVIFYYDDFPIIKYMKKNFLIYPVNYFMDNQ